MNLQHFQSLDEYTLNKLNEANDDGMIGNIIDKAASFIPRAVRFKKAKSTMAKALNGYIRKSKSVINNFSKGLSKKIDVINKQYSKMVAEKIQPLVDAGNTKQAAKMMTQFLKELEHYRDAQIQQLDKNIENIYNSYNAAIEKRIQSPGFVLNVELSEKGKGELMAKWQELSGLAKMKIDEKKEEIMANEGWRHLDNIISEVSSFVEENSYDAGDIEFKIQFAKPLQKDLYDVKVHLRLSGKRLSVTEKGVLVAKNQDDLEIGNSNASKHPVKGTYQYNANSWITHVEIPDTNSFIIPYLIVKQSKNPIYGEIISVDMAINDYKQGAAQKEKPKEDEEKPEQAIKGKGLQPLTKDEENN